MTARKRIRRNVSGYIWDRRLETALDDNNKTRETLSSIHDHLRAVNCANQVNLLLISQLLTDAILSLDKSRTP